MTAAALCRQLVRYFGFAPILAGAALFYGCAAAAPLNPSATSQASTLALESPDVTGVWEGTSIADCIGVQLQSLGRCQALQNITLTMFEQDHKVTGYYSCAFGTEDCRNQIEHGVIRAGTMKGRRLWMRVMLEDGSACYFTGIPIGGDMEGRYRCWGGDTTLEKGVFRARRSY